jgi:hypothetical protein
VPGHHSYVSDIELLVLRHEVAINIDLALRLAESMHTLTRR